MTKGSIFVIGVLGLTMLLAVACGGGGGPAPTQAPTDTPQSTATPQPTAITQPTPTPQPPATSAFPPAATATATTAAATKPPSGGADLVALGKEIYLNVPENIKANLPPGTVAPGPLNLWCSQCHTIEGIPEAIGLIGPEHTLIGRDAANRAPGLSAEEYLRQSILDPPAHVAEGVVRASPGLMTKEITQELTDEQINALVAFLLTLK